MATREIQAAAAGEIRVEKGKDGIRYILPRRDFGKARNIGWTLIFVGIIVIVFMLFWMSGVAKFDSHTKTDPVFNFFSIGMLLAGLPGLLAGIAIMVVGVAVLRSLGHSEILVSRDKLYSIECIGPFKFHFKRDISAIERLVVGDSTFRARTNDGPWKELSKELSLIKVEGKSGMPLLVAMAYPTPLVKVLAENLTASMSELAHRPGSFTVSDEKDIPVVDESGDPGQVDSPVPRPADSTAVVRELENGFAVVIPPAGLMKGSKGLFAFSMIWNIFMVIFTFSIFFLGRGQKDLGPLYLFILVFWLVGIGMLLGAINMGRRQTIIALVGGTFGVKTTGVFGTKETKLKLEDIGAVRMGPSGMEVNDKSIMELQVVGKDGKKKAKALSERKEDELQWIAWLIRSRTGLARDVDTEPIMQMMRGAGLRERLAPKD